MPQVNVAPRPEGPMSSNGFELLPGEKELHAVDVKYLTGEDVRLLITDRRLVTRASRGICSFPWNLCCICFRADVDDSYAIGDIKYVQPWTFKGAIASCLGCMYDAKKIPCCGWLPGMQSGGMKVNLARPKGDFVPGWAWFPSWASGVGFSQMQLAFQMKREEAEALRRALVLHPEATGLGYNAVKGN